MKKESKLNLNAGDYAISHCDSDKTYNGLEVHKMLCDAYIAGNNDTLDDDDEKIRHYLMNFVKINDGVNLSPDDAKKALAWLEKQGQKEKDILEDAILDGNEDGLIAETIKYKKETQGKQKASYTTIVETGNGGINALVTRELPTDEQKPADKIEPKFKVGDWVMLDRPVLITKVKDMPYNTHQYWTSDGTWFGDATKSKLWTIQDAKDGDVLISDYEGGICIAILKSVVSSNEIEIHCHLINSELFIAQSGFSNAIWHPATKEQRDTLLKAMADAGYIFDFEKKKLKNIVQKPEENNGNIGGISPNWSEEDERLCQCLIEDQEEALDKVRNNKYGHSEIISDLKEMYHERIDWLKSLKGRLKPQNRWKPSELQLGCLSDAIEHYNSLGYPASKLKELLDDLKKLKED